MTPVPLIASAVSNSSPIIALTRIGQAQLAVRVCKQVMIPPAVADEVGDIPEGIRVQSLDRPEDLTLFPTQLHAGECAAILLARQLSPEATLILDDWYARAFAQRQGLKVVGTIGVIIRAKRQGILPAALPLFDELRRVGFRMSDSLLAEARSLVSE